MQEGLLANGGQASASTPGAPPTNSSTDSVACESGSQSMSGFLVSWRANIRPKFVPLLSSLAGTPAARNLLLCQVGKKLHPRRADRFCLRPRVLPVHLCFVDLHVSSSADAGKTDAAVRRCVPARYSDTG